MTRPRLPDRFAATGSAIVGSLQLPMRIGLLRFVRTAHRILDERNQGSVRGFFIPLALGTWPFSVKAPRSRPSLAVVIHSSLRHE